MSDSFTNSPTPPPVPAALQVMDYDTPTDSRPGRRVILIVALITLGMLLLSVLALVGFRSAAVRVVAAPVPIVITPPPPNQAQIQAQIQQSMTDNNQRRLDDLLNDSPTSSTVVYEEDPVRARQLFGNGVCDVQASRSGMSQPFWSAFEPPVYRREGFWRQSAGGEREDAMLFAHQLTSKSGNVRLVVLMMDVELKASPKAGNECDVAIHRKLTYRVSKPTLAGTYPDSIRTGESLTITQDGDHNVIPIRWIDGSLRPNRNTSYNLRFFAGQADPKDSSHFTVDYDLGGTKGTIDGYLTDDDFLRIIPHGGKVDQGKWLIDKP